MKYTQPNSKPAPLYGPVLRATNDASKRALQANLKLPSTITNAEIEVFSALLDLQASAANDN